MKLKQLLLAACVLTGFVFTGSCTKKESSSQKPIDLSSAVLSKQELSSMIAKLGVFREKILLKGCDTIQSEEEAQAILEPLLESGDAIYDQIISNYSEIPAEDLEIIGDVTDQQLIELAIIATAANTPESPVDDIVSCASAALGIGAIREIISTTGALMTVQGTTALLKVLARRYGLGYIGLALAMYEFVDCMDWI